MKIGSNLSIPVCENRDELLAISNSWIVICSCCHWNKY